MLFSYKAIRMSPLDPMKCHKNILFVSIGALLVLLCLCLPSSHYFFLSPYTILKPDIAGPVTRITFPRIEPRDTHVEPRVVLRTEPRNTHVEPKVVRKTEPQNTHVEPKVQNTHVEPKVDPCTGRYIFIHDLPSKFNQDLVKNCRSLCSWINYCPYLENHGYGPQLISSGSAEKEEELMSTKSWYGTNQFMLSVIFHYRMKQYECLTTNSSLASAIYAPFYPGLEIGRYLFGDYNSSVKDAAAIEFTTWLRKKPEWGRMFGWDHFFVAGRITWDFRRLSNTNGDWGSKLLNLPEAKNMTMLTIEGCPHGNNDISIPYPTYFHPSSDNEVYEWQERVRTSKRDYLFAFGGAPRPNASRSIRGELISQCRNAETSQRCKLISCVSNDDMCNKPAYIIRMFMKADFCLQPPGDSYTRRSTFDSILAGCIPVFFHPGSAYIQYLWHFPKNYTKYSVFIPTYGIENGTVNVQEVLSRFTEDEVLAMREEVIKLIPSIIYARKKLKSIDDAFDLAVKGVLKRIEETRRVIREGKDPGNLFPEESSWKYHLTGEVGKHEWDSYF